MVAVGLGAAGLPILRQVRFVLRRLVLGDGLLEILQAELQLVGAELLRSAPELVAQQALDQQSQLVILGVQFALLVGRGADHLPQHLLQEGGIVR